MSLDFFLSLLLRPFFAFGSTTRQPVEGYFLLHKAARKDKQTNYV